MYPGAEQGNRARRLYPWGRSMACAKYHQECIWHQTSVHCLMSVRCRTCIRCRMCPLVGRVKHWTHPARNVQCRTYPLGGTSTTGWAPLLLESVQGRHTPRGTSSTRLSSWWDMSGTRRVPRSTCALDTSGAGCVRWKAFSSKRWKVDPGCLCQDRTSSLVLHQGREARPVEACFDLGLRGAP